MTECIVPRYPYPPDLEKREAEFQDWLDSWEAPDALGVSAAPKVEPLPKSIAGIIVTAICVAIWAMMIWAILP